MPTSDTGLKKALFLDRDGVINIDTGYVHKISDCRFTKDIFDICRLAKQNGFLLIVVTNQAGIARGFFTEKDFAALMDYMREEFIKQRCPLDGVFFCPYHPDGIPPYNRISEDRKPRPGMILKAAVAHSVDLSESIMLGDKESDMEAGKNAGVKWNIRYDMPGAAETIKSVIAKKGAKNIF